MFLWLSPLSGIGTVEFEMYSMKVNLMRQHPFVCNY